MLSQPTVLHVASGGAKVVRTHLSDGVLRQGRKHKLAGLAIFWLSERKIWLSELAAPGKPGTFQAGKKNSLSLERDFEEARANLAIKAVAC